MKTATRPKGRRLAPPTKINFKMCTLKNNETGWRAPEAKQNTPDLYIKDRGRSDDDLDRFG
jgi:hypothetical protein